MNWFETAALILVVLTAFLGWGFFRITKRAKDAVRSIFIVEENDVPALVDECVRVCRDKLGVSLDLNDLDNSTENLDYILEPNLRTRMKTAFEVAGHSGRFVLPLGAFLGELVRTHVPNCRWIARERGGLAMEVPQGAFTLTMHPFDKILKHAATGKTGDITAYIHLAIGKTPLSE